MTPADLTRAGTRMYGAHRWRSLLALNLGVDNATVYRWSRKPADWHLPHIAEVAVKGLLEHYRIVQAQQKRQRELDRRAGRLRPKLKRKKVSPRKKIMAAGMTDKDKAIDKESSLLDKMEHSWISNSSSGS